MPAAIVTAGGCCCPARAHVRRQVRRPLQAMLHMGNGCRPLRGPCAAADKHRPRAHKHVRRSRHARPWSKLCSALLRAPDLPARRVFWSQARQLPCCRTCWKPYPHNPRGAPARAKWALRARAGSRWSTPCYWVCQKPYHENPGRALGERGREVDGGRQRLPQQHAGRGAPAAEARAQVVGLHLSRHGEAQHACARGGVAHPRPCSPPRASAARTR